MDEEMVNSHDENDQHFDYIYKDLIRNFSETFRSKEILILGETKFFYYKEQI